MDRKAASKEFALNVIAGEEPEPELPAGKKDPGRVAKNGLIYTRKEFEAYYGPAWRGQWDECLVALGESCTECGVAAGCVKGRGEFQHQSYCEACWYKWQALRSRRSGWLPRALRARRHFDFIEVGTSDWCTISQYCAGDLEHGSCMGKEIRTNCKDIGSVRGLAVEPVRELLRSLPRLPHVEQVEAAMCEVGGEASVYYISAENIERYMGTYHATVQMDDRWGDTGSYTKQIDVMWYAKSMASVGKPHPELQHLLESVGRADLVETRTVKVLSWRELCMRYRVDSVDVVQLDCEGMDCGIIRGLLAHCRSEPALLPRVIAFEANWLTDPTEVEETLESLRAHGYQVRFRSWENICVERS